MRNGECCSRASGHSRDSADNVIASDIGLLVLSNVIYAQTVIGLIQPDDDKNSIVLLAGPGKDGRYPERSGSRDESGGAFRNRCFLPPFESWKASIIILLG